MKPWILFACGTLALVAAVLVASATWRVISLELPSDPRADVSRGPSRIVSRPLALRPGAPLGAEALEDHLRGAGYRRVERRRVDPGEYSVRGRRFRVGVRPFLDAQGEEPGGTLRVELAGDGRVAQLRGADDEPRKRARIEGALLGAFVPESGRDREPVRLDALPEHVPGAVLAIEDQRFFDHAGLDLRRIGGALVSNLRAGRVVEGGSTLTQQLAKNLYLTRERTLYRKLQELPLALLLEWNLEKEEILEAYLNEVYLGQARGVAIHGVGSAARHYFGKSAAELELHEAALLAGLLRGPTLYAPRRDPLLARARRDEVLARMLEQGRIDQAGYDAANAQPLGVRELWWPPASARWAVDEVKREVEQRFPDVALDRAGWRIETSLDLRLQRVAERAVALGVARLEERSEKLRRPGSPLQAALVAIEPRTGELLALVGGRDFGASQFDRARRARRQPGSLFKPVAALAALSPESGAPPRFTLATLLDDVPFAMQTPEGAWQPGNHDAVFRGPVTLRAALEHSLNVPMVRLGQAVGARRIVRAARRLGIESPLHAVPSLVLGTSEVTLLEMTRAFGVLAAAGWRADLRSVVGVRDAEGAIVLQAEPTGAGAVDPAVAHVLTSALRGVVDRGTGGGVRRLYRGHLAGKTGTTDDYRDAWFVGYTPDLVAGVWMGFDDGTSLNQSSSRAAVPLFAEFARDALGENGGRPFPEPPGVETLRVVANDPTGGTHCQPEVFVAGTGPDAPCSPFDWLDAGPLGDFGDWIRERPWWGGRPGQPPPPVGAPGPEASNTGMRRPEE
jgi:penicillin-binding protein 1B